MRSLRYLNTVLTVLCVLIALQLWTSWTSSPTAPTVATPALAGPENVGSPGGGIPDAGAQRNQIIDCLKRQLQQGDALMSFLKSGSLRAKLELPPKDSANGG